MPCSLLVGLVLLGLPGAAAVGGSAARVAEVPARLPEVPARFLSAPAAPAASPSGRSNVVGLYRVLLVRAAPGRLLELIDHHRMRFGSRPNSERPYLMRHSQGDQWDLLLLEPLGGATAESIVLVPEVAGPDSLVAWREELIAEGPGPESVGHRFREAGFFHVEMFVALAGAREALREQREMENAFLRAIGRPDNLVFTRRGGAGWDVFTIGAYRDLQHFAEPSTVSREGQEAAARAAGFEGSDRIGTYLRTLIASHHDTLAVAVALGPQPLGSSGGGW